MNKWSLMTMRPLTRAWLLLILSYLLLLSPIYFFTWFCQFKTSATEKKKMFPLLCYYLCLVLSHLSALTLAESHIHWTDFYNIPFSLYSLKAVLWSAIRCASPLQIFSICLHLFITYLITFTSLFHIHCFIF